ncbi:MAG: efflux RND transporter periplasmic adaptor subunit [Colwellia sp.]|nr:efflux RND transporter periplasmic adaptor subunit [Colwellia sp.]
MIKDTRQQDTVLTSKSKFSVKSQWASVVIISSVLLVYLYLTQSSADLSIEKSTVQLGTVERGNLERDINAIGKIVAANAPVIYSPAVGRVTLLVNPGDTITDKQALAKINSPELVNLLSQEQVSLQSLEFESDRQILQTRRELLLQEQQLNVAAVSLNAAKREFRRSEIAIQDNLISQIDYEKSQDDLTRAVLDFEHEQKQALLNKDSLNFETKTQGAVIERQKLVVNEIQRQVNNLTLYSPVAGIVGNWLTTQQSAVALSQPLMTIVDLTAFEAELSVPESYADEIGIGMPALLQVSGQLMHGTLSAISPEVINRQVTTRVRFDNQQLTNLRQNQRLTARIILETKTDVLMVRRGAFLDSGRSGEGKIIYLVNQDMATKQTVSFGTSSLSHIELTAGVEVGDQLIISSVDRFKNAEQIALR